jgi:hypothetical protein
MLKRFKRHESEVVKPNEKPYGGVRISGRYYLTADSAPPPPTKMIQDIDPDQIIENEAKLEELRERLLGPAELAIRRSDFFYTSPEDQVRLARLGVDLDLLAALNRESTYFDSANIGWFGLEKPE